MSKGDTEIRAKADKRHPEIRQRIGDVHVSRERESKGRSEERRKEIIN